ncbi:MAG: citrate/2-methylcitrate synthase, partial [Pseudomonadales bacterium]
MTQKVQITIDGKSSDLPTMEASEGNNVIDVRGLISEGMFTYDPGFLSTASCDSKITYIDGDYGILLYRGYPIEQLAELSNHLEASYLLLNGELPSQSEYDAFEASIKQHQTIDRKFQQIFNGFTKGAH